MSIRPALQHLLSRPSSLDFLQFLVGNTTPSSTSRRRQRLNGPQSHIRKHSGLGLAIEDDGNLNLKDNPENIKSNPQNVQLSRAEDSTPTPKDYMVPKDLFNGRDPTSNGKDPFEIWRERLCKPGQMDFESNLSQVTKTTRLLDRNNEGRDIRLWAFLLEYRYRIYGESGIVMFWDAIRTRGVQIPTSLAIGEYMWSTFLYLGLRDHTILGQICDYADELYDSTGRGWSRLYSLIIGHFLIHGTIQEVMGWHERLSKRHTPSAKRFSGLCRKVILSKGNMKGFKMVYAGNNHRNMYSKIVPVLCKQENFAAASQWHFFLLSHGDSPREAGHVEPLIKFLATYNRSNAARIIQSLEKNGIRSAPTITTSFEDSTKISREMMNLIHGQFMNMAPKAYNDNLGARWFATSWVSLDVAISSVHALGVQEIGPLSLQAIALREPDPKQLFIRIRQIKDLGISIGQSIFSRAVEAFSQRRAYDHLESLLASDQHPHELDDAELQENLLLKYSREKDWTQYRRILAIQTLWSDTPEIETDNIILRTYARSGDMVALFDKLSEMQQRGIVVNVKTISVIMKEGFLIRRRRGRRPMSTFKTRGSLNQAISVLKTLTVSPGSYVPARLWREILRRLGMTGQLQDLEKLSMFLGSWYNPSTRRSLPRQQLRYRLPIHIPTSHPFHPLHILFNAAFQKAVVEWGFIHSLQQPQYYPASSSILRPSKIPSTIPDVSFGIKLLRKLHAAGVYIDFKAVRKAVFHRLVIYYGPGRSSKANNRRARLVLGVTANPGNKSSLESLGQMVIQIDEAFGFRQPYFARPNVAYMINLYAKKTLLKLANRKNRRLARHGSMQLVSQNTLRLGRNFKSPE